MKISGCEGFASDKKEDFFRRSRGSSGQREGSGEGAAVLHPQPGELGGGGAGRPAGVGKQDFLEGYLRKLSHTVGVEPFVVYQTAEAVRLAHEVLLGEVATAMI